MTTPALSVRVVRKLQEAVGICSFELVSADGRPLPSFSAGSHIEVYLPDSVTRHYSLCNRPHESHRYLIGVLKDPASRGGSKMMHESVHEGDLLQISAPKNHFALAHAATRSVLMAGGIGITPLLCMAERLSMVGANFELHYSARSADRMAFRERILQSAFASSIRLHLDDAGPAQKLDVAALLATPAAGTHLYVCGPKGFMDAVLSAARAAGWPEPQLHYEFFSAELLRFDSDGSFEVQLASSGKIIMVPKDKTVLEALTEAGVEIESSCEQGVYGTCLTRVLEGMPDHRDLFLTLDEQAMNDQFTPCCSRSKSPLLVLDL